MRSVSNVVDWVVNEVSETDDYVMVATAMRDEMLQRARGLVPALKKKARYSGPFSGRGGRIRTSGPCLPKAGSHVSNVPTIAQRFGFKSNLKIPHFWRL